MLLLSLEHKHCGTAHLICWDSRKWLTAGGVVSEAVPGGGKTHVPMGQSRMVRDSARFPPATQNCMQFKTWIVLEFSIYYCQTVDDCGWPKTVKLLIWWDEYKWNTRKHVGQTQWHRDIGDHGGHHIDGPDFIVWIHFFYGLSKQSIQYCWTGNRGLSCSNHDLAFGFILVTTWEAFYSEIASFFL